MELAKLQQWEKDYFILAYMFVSPTSLPDITTEIGFDFFRKRYYDLVPAQMLYIYIYMYI